MIIANRLGTDKIQLNIVSAEDKEFYSDVNSIKTDVEVQDRTFNKRMKRWEIANFHKYVDIYWMKALLQGEELSNGLP